MKKTITTIICLLLVVAFAVSIFLNIDAFNSKSTLYTKEQMDEACEKAYAEGNKNEQGYKIQIANLQTELENAQAEISRLEPLDAKYAEAQTRINSLKAEIEYYQNLLGLENNENLIYVNFYFNNEIIDTKIVESGLTITGSVDTSKIDEAGYILNFWQDEEGQEVKLSSKPFVTNTNLFANTTKKVVETAKYSMTVVSKKDGVVDDAFKFVNKDSKTTIGVLVNNGNEPVEITDTKTISNIEEGSLVTIRICSTRYEQIKDIKVNNNDVNIYSGEIVDGILLNSDLYTITYTFVMTEDVSITINYTKLTFPSEWWVK